MRMRKWWLPCLLALGFYAAAANGDEHDGESRFQQDLDERDFEAVRDFVNAKRSFDLAEKSSNLSISGDVRARWRYLSEKLRGENLRGGADGIFVFREEEIENDEIYLIGERLPISKNEFDAEFNLRIDYATDCTWASTWICFDEAMGLDDNGLDCSIDPEGYHGSGSRDNLCLKQAYMGYNVYDSGCSRLDIELGRRGYLYQVFDSQIQFLSRIDGILFTYCSNFECVGDWAFRAAGFVVDERVNQLAWIAEVSFYNMWNTGIDFKYSFIDWVKNGRNRCFSHNPIGFKFKNSQFSLAYRFSPEFLCQPAKLYGAFLINHSPAQYTFIDGIIEHIGRQNLGWYVGLQVGEICKEGDWAMDLMYAVVQAQCMPDNDVRNIGTGNVLENSFTADGLGNTNWSGWQFTGAYALTDNLVLNGWVEYSQAYDKKIAGNHQYSNVTLEAIYAF